MKTMNQLLNVIGNGIRDNDDLREHLTFRSRYTRKEADLWIKNKIFYGYKEVEKTPVPGLPFPIGDPITLREDQRKDHSEIVYTELSPKYPFSPYPNFKKEYSTIWRCPAYLDLSNDWLEMAIEFYKYCRVWLKKNESKYSYAFPRPTKEETRRFLAEV
jgi:hypothetical protein